MSNTMADVQASVIGILQIYDELFGITILKPEYFIGPYKNIFYAMYDYFSKHNAITMEGLFDYPGFDVDLYLRCADTVYSKNIDNFKRLENIVIEKYKQRMVIELSDKLRTNEITLEEYDTKYQNVNTLKAVESYKLDAEKLTKSCSDDKKNIFFRDFKQLGILMRLKENDLVIIAGATGTGKSGFALNLLNDLSHNYKCLYFNLEMVPEELHQRLIAINCGIEQNSIGQYKTMNNNQMSAINNAINSINQRNIEVVDKSQSIDTIRSMIAGHESDNHMIVFIDHISLIGSRARNSFERMTEIAKELRKMSLDYNCTIIGLCQLNREATKTEGKPKLSMLRDSGEIEQSASKVLFVWSDQQGYSLVLEKNRSGSVGYIPIDYNKRTQIIHEVRK